ncbi:MAG: porin [Saprospirales bacterium]|nr:porin [Saprospirales bacterium]
MKNALLLALLFCAVSPAISKNDSLPDVDLSGFVDVYYAYDFSRPENHERPAFLYNHKRHNEFNLNLGLASLKIDGGNYRAALGLMAGTYAQYNLAAEQSLLQHVYEANAGIALNKTRSLWLDAGIFSSHIDFEGAISADNYTLTRSIAAENSPYYLAGAKLSWDPGEKWDIALLAFNGWQRIQRVGGNSLPAFGSQVVFYPCEGVRLNWSTFVGSDDPDATRRMRYFNNLYGEFQFSEKISLLAGFDMGWQQEAKGNDGFHTWLTPVGILKFALAENWAMALRGEYFQDENGVIVATGTPSGFKTTGFSLNIDRRIRENAMLRLEGRWFNSEDPIFGTGNDLTRDNYSLVCALSVKIP